MKNVVNLLFVALLATGCASDVGTYAPATNFVHINLKVVSAESQLVLAAADYGLPLDENTKILLHSGR
jgi:hypothetical protein